MRCPSCNQDNQAGAKFCVECGTGFQTRCAKCGCENPRAAKFCQECGASFRPGTAPQPVRLAPPTSLHKPAIYEGRSGESGDVPDGERKTITALFADIKGSMDLMEDLDPEKARAIVDPALGLMIDAVHRYDGYIVQSTGDGVFALFGAPVAHEDHPQRALYAALRIQDEMRRYSAKLRTAGNPAIEARVGINTGEVVVRSLKTGDGNVEYTPIGHSTSLASRMQTLAPTGSIATTGQVKKLCEGYFVFKDLGPARVKGVGEPVNVYEVTGLGPLRTRLQVAARRGLTRFVGREVELAQMRRALESALEGHGQIVAAMGEAGVGKSRLFFEFKAVAQSGCLVLEAYSVSHGKASAYLPVFELLREYFGITAQDDPRQRRQKVIGKVLELDRSLEDTLPYVFALLAIYEGDDPLAQMDVQIRRRRTQDALKRIFLRETLNQPLILVFEDLHWIDSETQALLDLLADSIANARILLLVNYRPEYRHVWGSRTHYTQLRLDPLGVESADKMIDSLLGVGPPPPDPREGRGVGIASLKRLVLERTQGNPFFIEEIVQVLFDEGVLVRNGIVKVTRAPAQVHLPPTVRGILSTRIDRLPAEERELLHTLAVLGREFPLGLVQRVTLKSNDELEPMLSRLRAGEFIYEQPALPETEYIFKHALTQEVAYNSLLSGRRKLLHERAGQAMEAMFAEQLDDHLSELAHHYSRSDNITKAIEYLGRAGHQAMQRCAHADAISSLTAAIDLLQRLPDSPQRIQQEALLQLAVGPALLAVKGWAGQEAERAYTRVRELCERLGDPPQLFAGLFGLWNVFFARARLRSAYELAEQLLRRAQSAQDPATVLYARLALGITSYWMGKFAAARQHLETAISLYDDRGRDAALALSYAGINAGVWCLSYAAFTLLHLGYPEQALKRVNEAVALAEELSDPPSLAMAEISVCAIHQGRREVRAAQETAERIIALCAEHGLTAYSILAVGSRGWAMAEQGRNEEGIAQLQEALVAIRAMAAVNLPSFLCLMAEACRKSDRLDDGLSALTQSLSAADENELREYEAETHRLKGELLLMQDHSQVAQAERCFERAIEIARNQSAKSLELRATTSLARLLAKQGKRGEARAMLAEIYGWFTEGFEIADLEDAKALLDELDL